MNAQHMYGAAAFATCHRVVPFGATAIITKSRSPNGGVVRLISSARSIISPNQTKSNWRDSARGKKIGTVKSIMET